LFPDVTVIVVYIVNLVITFSVITLLFGVIFKVLPDAKMKWRDVLSGAIATAILFMIGKFAISFYIGKSDVGGTYGAAGSLVILLLWVYYSSIILYFGAEFTVAYARELGHKLVADQYAVWEKEPAIAGAKAETPPEEMEQNQRRKLPGARNASPAGNIAPGRLPLPVYQYLESNEPVKAKKKSDKPGMFALLTGLLLYFVNTSAKKKGISSS
jgi:membrane protein